MPATSTPPKKPANHRSRRSFAWWGLLPVLVIMGTGALLSWHSLGDLDIWFHLRSGRDILDGQGVTAVNRYSFTEPDHPWVNHEWMFQILATSTGPANSLDPESADEPNVAVWNMLRLFLTLLLLLVILVGDRGIPKFMGKEGASALAWSGIPILMGIMLLWPRLTLRPELFSYIFFVILIRWAEEVFQPGATRLTWSSLLDPRKSAGRIFFLTILWAQFHGFASVVPGILLLAGILVAVQNKLFVKDPGRSTEGPSLSIAVGIVLLATLALMLTPNGWNGLLMPVRALGQFSQSKVDLRTTISELVPLQDSPNSLALTINLYRASLIWGFLWIVATWGRISLFRIAVFVLAALAAWTNQRSIGLYAVAFMLLHTGAPAQPWRFALPRLPAKTWVVTGLLFTVAFAGVFWPCIVSDDFYLHEGVSRRFGSGVHAAHFPVTAASALATAGTDRYFANLDAAAFLLAHVPGRNYIDARTEAYSPELWSEYLAIKKGDDRALAILAERRVQAVCLAVGGGSFDRLAMNLLASPNWDLWTAEGAGLLFRKSGNTAPMASLEQAGAITLAQSSRGSATRRGDYCLAAGNLYKFTGNENSREDAFRRGLGFRESHPTLQHNLGNLLMNRQDFQGALPLFLGALEINPRLAGSALNAGVCQMRLGNPGAAEKSFARATAIEPGNFEAWANLGASRLGSGNPAGAQKALEKALEIKPGDRRLEQMLKNIQSGPGN